MLLWPPDDVSSARALLHDRRGGRSITVEGSPQQHLPVRLLPQLLPSVSSLRLSSLPWAAQGTAVHSSTLLPLLAGTKSSSEGKRVSEEN